MCRVTLLEGNKSATTNHKQDDAAQGDPHRNAQGCALLEHNFGGVVSLRFYTEHISATPTWALYTFWALCT